jgi:hypothetical protein
LFAGVGCPRQRYQSEKLVRYLGEMIGLEKDRQVTKGRFRGAYSIPHHTGKGTLGYLLRVSGFEEREIRVDLSSLADGCIEV